jgi:hypothetical protein
MCGVQSEADLLELWPVIAALDKRDHLTIDPVINTVAQDSGQPEHASIITPELAKRLVSLRLSGDNMEDLVDGLQPFAFTIRDYSTQDSEDDACDGRRRVEEYDMLTAGSTSTTLQDVQTLRSSGKAMVRRDFRQCRALLQAQNNMTRAVLGVTHPVTLTFHQFLTAYMLWRRPPSCYASSS